MDLRYLVLALVVVAEEPVASVRLMASIKIIKLIKIPLREFYDMNIIVINKHICYLFTIIYDGDVVIVTDTDTFVSTIGFPRDRKLVGIDFDSCKTLLGRVILQEGSCVLLVFALGISLFSTTKSAYFDSKVLTRVSPNADISFNFCSF